MVEKRSRLLDGVLVAILFVGLLAALAVFVHCRIGLEARKEAGALLARQTERDRMIQTVFDGLKQSVTAVPCSQTFREQLHRYAFLPDGISDFFHASDGWVMCSLNVARFAAPVDLGTPDVTDDNGSEFWIDRDLAAFELAGMTGTIVKQNDIGFLLPAAAPAKTASAWLDLEAVRRLPNGGLWHRDGTAGLYSALMNEARDWRQDILCDDAERRCVAFRAHPTDFVLQRRWEIIPVAALLAGVAVALAALVKAWVRRRCSFESRFRRLLSADTIVCSYQPVMDLRSGRVVGCEVLARWRDVDGCVVMPDRFIPLVESNNATLEFTRSMVAKALRELRAALPADMRLDVAFNVFPKDLADLRLPKIFRLDPADGERFSIIAEIVESEAFCADEAWAQVEALRKEGVSVYLDDFGAGYSNIQNLAALPLEGVKLDRAFAMAPDDSLMAKMLANAIELINVSDRVIVVEGVETAARIEHLRSIGSAVDRVQGYHISRPLPIDAFATFLLAHRDGSEPRLAAA